MIVDHGRMKQRISVVLALATALLVGAPAAAHASPVSAQSLRSAVDAALTQRATKSHAGTHVEITRRDGDSRAFGTAVLKSGSGTDDHPEGWLFLAERSGGAWKVALDGTTAFGDMAAESGLLSVQERGAFTGGTVGVNAGSDFRTGMRLPFAVGQSWGMYGGPHPWGSSGAWSSLDLAGGDGRVLAARGGTAYTMCKGWVRVIHDRGYSTDYYHLFNNISANGLAVGEGAFLGNQGTDVTCGGAATGAHVHFGLRQNSAYVGIAGHGIGKWAIENGGAAYQGSALHGSNRVYAGGGLYNYGALGFTQGVVDANGGGSLNKRSGPGTGYGVVGSVGDGATVTISCSSYGTSHTGRYGTTNLWNRLSDGTWISDAFLWTGVNGTINGFC